MEDSFEARFHLAVQKRCSKLYGDSIPKQVLDRIAVEWAVLQDKCWMLLFEALSVIADISRENGCCFRIHGAVESSLIAYLLGLTKADPLPVHYLCPHCKRVEFITDGSVKCAPDLSERICPVCGTNLNRSGFDLQWYIGSMEKISYLVPRSVCVRYALAAYRSAWISNNYLPTIIPEGIETVRGALLSPFATDG